MTDCLTVVWTKQKAYVMKNFNELVVIIAGLNTELVEHTRMQVHTLSIRKWEAQLLHDLTDWTACTGNFEHVWRMVDSVHRQCHFWQAHEGLSQKKPCTSKQRIAPQVVSAPDKRPPGRPMFALNMTTSDKAYGRLRPFGARNMITRPRSPAIYGRENMIGPDKHMGELHGAWVKAVS